MVFTASPLKGGGGGFFAVGGHICLSICLQVCHLQCLTISLEPFLCLYRSTQREESCWWWGGKTWVIWRNSALWWEEREAGAVRWFLGKVSTRLTTWVLAPISLWMKAHRGMLQGGPVANKLHSRVPVPKTHHSKCWWGCGKKNPLHAGGSVN